MATFSSRQAARLLGLTAPTLSRYIKAKKIPAPKSIDVGGFRVYVWSEADIGRARKLLPKIENGRKTRYKKKLKQEQKKWRSPKKK
jgi:excisionase family DNA binding protein